MWCGLRITRALFLSTLSLRRATQPCWHRTGQQPISIHALLAESDYGIRDNPASQGHFYPRSPCGERPHSAPSPQAVSVFLSTLSLRRATAGSRQSCRRHTDFYPRSPCGERRSCPQDGQLKAWISIHALLAESDGAVLELQCILGNFYPRSPCGERLFSLYGVSYVCIFLSTLSLRRATWWHCNRHFFWYFYPRSPCGERR